MQSEYLDAHPEVDGVYGPMVAFFPDGRTQPWAHDRPLVVEMDSALLDANMSVQTRMIRRRALEVLNGFDESLAILEDQAFSIEIARAALHVVFLPATVVTRLRRNDKNLTSNALRYFLCDCRIALRYRQISAQLFGPGSVRIHLCRALRRFGKKSRGLGLPIRACCSFIKYLTPRSRMPRGR
jgi:GT2 family glycosyltransferase